MPARFAKWLKHLKKYHNWLLERNISPLEANILNALQVNKREKIIVGINSLQELKEIITIINKNKKISNINQFTINDKMLINPSN